MNYTPGETLAERKSVLDPKSTLGLLLERLRGSVRATDPKGFEKYVSEVLAQRNELIHHFCQLPFGRMSSAEECDAALADLSRRIEFALPLYNCLHGMLSEFTDLLAQLKLQNEVADAP